MSNAVSGEHVVFTCVRDASKNGGGVAGVALPLHQALSEEGANYRILYEFGESNLAGSRSHSTLEDLQNLGSGGLVHVHGLWFPFETRVCREALKRNMKLVISPHGMLDPWAMKQKRWKKTIAWTLYQKRLLEKADLLIVNSEQEKRNVLRLGVRAPIAVIPNGVALDAAGRGMTRQQDQRTVLFLSRVAPGKGVPELLEAWSRIPDKRGFRLRIVGYADTAYQRKIERLIARLGISATVVWEGPLYGRAKWQAYCDADYFILPSHSENFGIVVAEALVAGLPVITTDQTPWQHLAEEGAGWICGVGAEAVEQALRAALVLPEFERLSMAKNARSVSENYSWHRIASRYHEAYSWLQGGLRKPDWVDDGPRK
ncbi:glycosyltransferase [Pseudomonas putida]|uniref:glycosyltransferase n=1 Tax=Pseudomonas TaxID=286 RepID=UPI0034679904